MVPDIVIAGAPGVIVCPLRIRSDLESREKVKPSIVRRSGADVGSRVALAGIGTGNVAPSIASASPEGRSEIVSPDIVIAGAPGVIVCPLIIRSDFESREKVRPSTVKRSSAGVAAVGIGYVELPITRPVPEGRREIGVPDIVRAGAPGVIVRPLMIRSEIGPRVNVKPSIVRIYPGDVADSPQGGIGITELPTARAVPEGMREIGVLKIVRAEPPGVSVWLPRMISEPGPLEKVKPS